MLENVTLTQLRAFSVVARERNFTHAAAELNYTPPAVHQQLRALERTLGFALVRRQASPLELTNEGAELLPRVNALLDQMGEITHAVRTLQGTGQVSVGAGRNTGVFILMPLLTSYADAEPADQVDLRVATADSLVEQVIDGEIDLAVSAKLSMFLDETRRLRDHVLLIPWARDRSVVVEKAGGIERGQGARRIFLPPYAEMGQMPDVYHAPDDPPQEAWRYVQLATGDAAKSAALNGVGRANLPYSAVHHEIASGELRVVEFRGEAPFTIHLLHRRPSQLSAPVRRFLRHLLSNRPQFPVNEQHVPRRRAMPQRRGNGRVPVAAPGA